MLWLLLNWIKQKKPKLDKERKLFKNPKYGLSFSDKKKVVPVKLI